MEGYQKIKDRVAKRDSQVLLDLMDVYLQEPEEMKTDELVVFTAISSELENRGLIRYDAAAAKYVEV